MATANDPLTIYANGDLKLLVGTHPARCLQVSSHVLCIASDVFRTMLDGRFRESQAFKRSNNADPFELKLPDDDLNSMIIVCNILHLRFAELPAEKDVDIPRLLAIVKIVDKYNMHAATSFKINIWLLETTQALPLLTNRHQLRLMLAAAFSMNEATAFREIAKRVLINCSPKSFADDVLFGTLPYHVLVQLDRTRVVLVKAIRAILTEGILGTDHIVCPGLEAKDLTACIHHTVNWSLMIQGLHSRKVFPFGNSVTVSDLLRALNRVSPAMAHTRFAGASNMGRICVGKNRSPYDLAMEVKEKIVKIADGVCLDCIRAGPGVDDTCPTHQKEKKK